MDQFDVLIIGAGVVGLAVCAELSGKDGGSAILLVERHEKFGQETSSRNSEVIHSGIYYPAGSLKAMLCAEGNKKLYDFCEAWDVPHKRLGKLIVARDDAEVGILESLMARGRENMVDGLEFLDKSQVCKMEPCVSAKAAIFSPSTGIVDSHALMARLESIARKNGAFIAYGYEVVKIEKAEGFYTVTCRTPDGNEETVACRFLVNCAGLGSDRVASMPGIDIDRAGYRLHPCKGEYFSISGPKANLVERLVYPPPLEHLKGLGIHVTKSLDGRIRLGPSAFYVDEIEYSVNPDNAAAFYNAAKTYLPFIELDDLSPDMSGIRPKLQRPGDDFRDFVIRHEADRGLPGVINLLGIESPGLTSCLSIAEMVGNIIWQMQS